MKIVNLEQNSPDWASWRNKGLGASTAPTIMGVSPWSSPFELWTELTGLVKRPEPNIWAAKAMQRGHDLEPLARSFYEAMSGSSYPALCAEHDEYPFIRASLDGYNAEKDCILEIKCPGKVDHTKALKRTIPEKYWPQLMHQMLVTGAKEGVYYSFDGENGVAISFKRDDVYIAKLQEALITFWGRVQMQMAPPATKADLERATKRLTEAQKLVDNSIRALELVADNLGG